MVLTSFVSCENTSTWIHKRFTASMVRSAAAAVTTAATTAAATAAATTAAGIPKLK